MILLVEGLVAEIPHAGSVIVATRTTLVGSVISKIPTSPLVLSSRGHAKNRPSTVTEISCVWSPEGNEPRSVAEGRALISQISTMPGVVVDPQPAMYNRFPWTVTSCTVTLSVPVSVVISFGAAGLLTSHT